MMHRMHKGSKHTATLLLSTMLIASAWAQQAAPDMGGMGAMGGMPPGGAMPAGAAPAGAGAMPGGMPAGMPPMGPPAVIKAAVDIKDGAVQPAAIKSAKVSGKIGKDAANGLTLSSTEDLANGVYIHGKTNYTLTGAKIEMSGRGKSDFDGVAAAVLAKDEATVILRNVKIVTNGVVSTATTATDKTVMKVYNSTLIANGGPFPSGYERKIGPGMMEPPHPLGIVGSARTNLTMGEAKSYFYNSTIIADSWGALSTDAAHGAYLEANNCVIRVIHSGYGTYADNGASVVLNNSKMDVATYGGVIAGQASIVLNNVTGTSGSNLVMIHSVMGAPTELPTLTIKGGDYKTRNAVILVKSANADIVIDSAKLTTTNGDLILAVNNDDSNATKTNGAKVVGVKAAIKNSNLLGNLVNIDKDRGLAATLVNSSLKGVVKNASIALDGTSKWTATADSTVTLVGNMDVARIDAPAGVTIKATAGAGNNLKGSYKLAGGGVLNVAN